MEKCFSYFYDEMMSYVDYDSWAELIKERLDKLIVANKVLEIGCGTGEIIKRLQESFHIEGLDYSENMIKQAKKKCPNINFITQDMKELEKELEYDAVIANFDTLNYLQNLDELDLVFKKVSCSLKDKGVFLFDVLNRKMIEKMFPEGIFADDRENMTIIWKHNYNEEKDLDEINTSFFVREESGIYKRYDEVFIKKIFSNKEILHIAEKNGLKFSSKEINIEIAGPRFIYLFQKVG